MLLNNQQITEEIKKEIKKKHKNEWKWKHNNPKRIGFSTSSAKGKVHINTNYLKTQEKNQINDLTLYLKQLEKEEAKNPRVRRRQEIIKSRAELNKKKIKRDYSKNQQK